MAKKANKKAAPRIAAKFADLLGTAAQVGYSSRQAFNEGVKLARATKSSKAALDEAGRRYKCGYIVSYLEEPFAKAWGNMSLDQRFEAAATIMAKASPDSTKPDRRTDVEHKACRAADTSWSTAKRQAGIEPTKKGGRKPRQGSTAKDAPKAPPVDMVKASPRFTAAYAKEHGFETPKAAANDYFVTAAAALLATVDKNAKLIAPALSSAISDFKAAIAKAVA